MMYFVSELKLSGAEGKSNSVPSLFIFIAEMSWTSFVMKINNVDYQDVCFRVSSSLNHRWTLCYSEADGVSAGAEWLSFHHNTTHNWRETSDWHQSWDVMPPAHESSSTVHPTAQTDENHAEEETTFGKYLLG